MIILSCLAATESVIHRPSGMQYHNRGTENLHHRRCGSWEASPNVSSCSRQSLSSNAFSYWVSPSSERPCTSDFYWECPVGRPHFKRLRRCLLSHCLKYCTVPKGSYPLASFSYASQPRDCRLQDLPRHRFLRTPTYCTVRSRNKRSHSGLCPFELNPR